MDERRLRALLARVVKGETSLDEAVGALKHAPFEQLGDTATIDHHRTLRVGMPEVVLAESKTAAQVAAIAKRLATRGPLLVTRLARERPGCLLRNWRPTCARSTTAHPSFQSPHGH